MKLMAPVAHNVYLKILPLESFNIKPVMIYSDRAARAAYRDLPLANT